jgi:ATP-binding protein involved in chromosome partitioning
MANLPKNIKIDGSTVSLEIVLPYPGKSVTDGICKQVVERLKLDGVETFPPMCISKLFPTVQRGVKLIPASKILLLLRQGAVSAKATTAVNLALALCG